MEGGYGFLLDLALILLSTKLLGLLTQRFQLPQVVGALLAGLILGPAVLNVIQETEFIKDTAEIGVIVMMFCAGMETDVNELKHSGSPGGDSVGLRSGCRLQRPGGGNWTGGGAGASSPPST